MAGDEENFPNIPEKGFQRVCEKSYGYISSKESFPYIKKTCLLKPIEQRYKVTAASTSFTKNWAYSHLFDSR